MKTCLIILGGRFCELPKTIRYDYCIACDLGLTYAERLGIRPDMILGDFDSLGTDPLNDVQGIPIQIFPVRKDDTDAMLGVKKALKEGYDHIILTCALGGRMDHTLANIQTMAYVASHGAKCELISETEHLETMTGGTLRLPREDGRELSLLALTDRCTGVCIRGAKYNGEDLTLTNDFPLGHGNEWVEDDVELSMKSGTLLIIRSEVE